MRRAASSLASALALCACAHRGTIKADAVIEAPPPPPETGWKAFATPADREQLRAIPVRMGRAIAAVPRRFAARLRAEGALLDPDGAQARPDLPPGPYHCRLVRLGGRAGLASYPPDFCYVQAGDGDALGFDKQTGTYLPQGWMYPDPDSKTRLVFLGALRPAAVKAAPLHGASSAADIAGVVERVSAFRWRLTLTRARPGDAVDLYELVPVTPAVPGARAAVPAPEHRG